jgi:hypothetical protein
MSERLGGHQSALRTWSTSERRGNSKAVMALDSGERGGQHMDRKIEVEFDEFGWEALTELARREGVSIEELVRHAAMYYLADVDSERFSHRVPRFPGPRDRGVPADEVRRQA